ncbi:hypothetical protein PN502_08890 [Microcystis aeruginosa CS-338/01]|nr:hypothetical protein [Microcystis aeruginosa CS-338/01]
MSIVFALERTNQLSLLLDKNLVDLCRPIEPYQVTNNQINNLLKSEDREVFMALSQSYLEWKEATKLEGLQQGLQQGQRQIIENLMQVRFGELDESLIKVIDELLKLSPMESSRLLLESSREDLIRRFLSE